ncbi:MAG: anthranilate synthase component II [Gemmatimonadales bacterium]
MVLVLDNYDSFTYNLVQYLGELGAEPVVKMNDETTLEEIQAAAPAGIVISPGPGVPEDAGISIPLVRWSAGRIPLLGVCLGHQAIGAAFGGKVVRADRLVHGKTSHVVHTASGVFRDLPSPMTAMRYHSLLVERSSLPDCLVVNAWTGDRPEGSQIMGLMHRSEGIHGVQFHPESIGTELGKTLIHNFLQLL